MDFQTSQQVRLAYHKECTHWLQSFPYSKIIEWLHNSYFDLSQQKMQLQFITIWQCHSIKSSRSSHFLNSSRFQLTPESSQLTRISGYQSQLSFHSSYCITFDSHIKETPNWVFDNTHTLLLKHWLHYSELIVLTFQKVLYIKKVIWFSRKAIVSALLQVKIK